ncbi:MAG: putative lipid II flippase FtsW [Candidatus Competibacterales bacterium]
MSLISLPPKAEAPGSQGLDGPLCLAAAGLAALGLLMLTSASLPLAVERYDQPFHFALRQGVFLVVGLVAARLMLAIPLGFWEYRSGLALAAAVGLLVLVLIPGVGREVNGSTRWIDLGVVNLQVSEPAKLLVLIYLAGYLDRHGQAMAHQWWAMLKPLLVLGLLGLLLLLEPDFGAAAVLLAMALGMMFLAGVHVSRFVALQGVVALVLLVLICSSEYRLRRLLSFFDPFADPFGSGFQLVHALIAVGLGGGDGSGLGHSVQKLAFLPEAHTDFIFAVLAEELGLWGVVGVVVLFAVVVGRAFAISAPAQAQNDTFAATLAAGIGLWFGLQALINMGVNLGLLPTKGLTLPLMSYGGSSLVVMCAALGLLLRIGVETANGADRGEDAPEAQDPPGETPKPQGEVR